MPGSKSFNLVAETSAPTTAPAAQSVQPDPRTAAENGAKKGSPDFVMLGFFALIFVAFYLMFIRPQNKQRKEHEQMLGQLKAGDRVVTTGGIYGTIVSVSDKTMMLRIADSAVIEIARPAVAAKVDAAAK